MINGYVMSGDRSLTIRANKQFYNVDSNHVNYDTIFAKVRAKDYEGLEPLINIKDKVERSFNRVPGSKGLVVGSQSITYNGFELQGVIVDKILEFQKNNWDSTSLVKFLDNLMQNPSKRSVDTLYEFLSKHGLVITEDGHFLAYKSVNSNFRDVHTNTIDNHVGQIVELDRNQISDDPNHACHYGLHVGAIEYVGSFNGPVKLLVKVNPRDVVCVPYDANFMKMRVCRYEVIEDLTGNFVSVGQASYAQPYVEEDYEDEMNDEEYDAWLDGQSYQDDEDDEDEDDEETSAPYSPYDSYYSAYGRMKW